MESNLYSYKEPVILEFISNKENDQDFEWNSNSIEELLNKIITAQFEEKIFLMTGAIKSGKTLILMYLQYNILYNYKSYALYPIFINFSEIVQLKESEITDIVNYIQNYEFFYNPEVSIDNFYNLLNDKKLVLIIDYSSKIGNCNYSFNNFLSFLKILSEKLHIVMLAAYNFEEIKKEELKLVNPEKFYFYNLKFPKTIYLEGLIEYRRKLNKFLINSDKIFVEPPISMLNDKQFDKKRRKENLISYNFLINQLNNPDNKLITIVGEMGAGKTTLLQNLENNLWNSKENARIPLFFNCSQFENYKTSETKI